MKIEWSKYTLIDTNVLIYAMDPSDEFKHEIANEIFESMYSGTELIALSTQTLSETFNVFRMAKMAKVEFNFEDVFLILSDIVQTSEIPKLLVNPGTALLAARICQKSGAGYYDCLIAATMKEHGITKIYTEDEAFRKIEGITVVNPFEGKA